MFAGQDLEATARARQYFADYQPSSPSMALLRDGEVVHFVHRHQIEGRSPQSIAGDLTQAFDKYFGAARLSGHVFHPGHHELHGITVVVETDGDADLRRPVRHEDERGRASARRGHARRGGRRVERRVRAAQREVRRPGGAQASGRAAAAGRDDHSARRGRAVAAPYSARWNQRRRPAAGGVSCRCFPRQASPRFGA